MLVQRFECTGHYKKSIWGRLQNKKGFGVNENLTDAKIGIFQNYFHTALRQNTGDI